MAKRCQELGIRDEFRPGLRLNWYGRGENAVRDRRTELRAAAKARAAADAKAAKTAIEARTLDVTTALIAGGLGSKEARAFLDNALPSVSELMPTITVAALEQASK